MGANREMSAANTERKRSAGLAQVQGYSRSNTYPTPETETHLPPLHDNEF